MSKTKAVVFLSILLVLVLALSVFAFVPQIYFGYNKYSSPVSYLTKGQDIGKGAYVVYDFSLLDLITPEYTARMKQLKSVVANRLADFGYGDATISISDKQLTVTVPNASDLESVKSLLSKRGDLTISLSEDDDDDIIVTRDQILKATVQYVSSSNTSYVVLEISDEAKEVLQDATLTAGINSVKIFFLLDGETYTTYTAEQQINSNLLYMTTNTLDSAKVFAAWINSGVYKTVLTEATSGTVAALFPNVLTGVYICCGVIILAIIAAFIIRYGIHGVAAALSLVLMVVLELFALALIGKTQLTLPGTVAFILGLVFFTISTFVSLEKVQNQWTKIGDTMNLERRLYVSFERGLNMNILPTVESHAVVFVATLISLFLVKGIAGGFASVALYSLAFSALGSLLFIRMFGFLLIRALPADVKYYKLTHSEAK